MGYSALSHGVIPSFYGASHHCVRQGRVVGVKLKSKRSYGDLKLDDKKWEAPILEWTIKWRAGQCMCSGQELAADETTPSKPSSSVTSRRPLLSPAKTLLEKNLTASGKVFVIAASTREEFLAAATLRAQIFYSYPQADVTLGGMEAVKARVANDFLVNDLLKTRVKSEFSRESKFEVLGMRVKCLLAVCRQSTFESLSFPGGCAAKPSQLAPPSVASVDTNGTEPLVAIGTLDIQVHKGTKGVKDYFPVEQENTLEQAYIFNVCVVKEARRIGVAKALMVAALKVAKQMELQILFVHVEADNVNALALYNSLGYAVEEEEAVEVESLLRRPRRMLLSFWVV